MEKINYEGGIDFDSKKDYLGEAFGNPYKFLTPQGLKKELMLALTANTPEGTKKADAITEELQSRSKPGEPSAYNNSSLSVGDSKRAPK